MLNSVFVSGLPAFVGITVHQQLSCSLQCMHASVRCFHAFDRSVLFCKSLFVKCQSFRLVELLCSKILSVSSESCIF